MSSEKITFVADLMLPKSLQERVASLEEKSERVVKEFERLECLIDIVHKEVQYDVSKERWSRMEKPELIRELLRMKFLPEK